MRKTRLFWQVALAAALLPTCAHADPISTAILTWVTTAAFVASTTGTIIVAAIDIAFAVGISYAQRLLAGSPKTSALGVSGTLQGGGIVPRSFGVGLFSTAGSLVYSNTWGQSGKTPNAYITYVIALSDLPVSSLEEVWAYDEKVTYSTSGTPVDWGYPIPEYNLDGKDHLWVRFYDGTQSSADSWLVTQFGADPNYPYASDMHGEGVAYVIVTALLETTLFSGFPRYKFAMHGVKLYDPRKDSTNGGSGSHRFDDASTWQFSSNPKVVEYNILRGLTYEGAWFYGLQSLTALRLPVDSWFAAMNECDRTVSNHSGGSEAQFRCGGEISVDVQPADTIDGLETACNGRLAEIGGVYKTYAGAAGTAIVSFDDSGILVTEQQSFDQFPSLSDLINSITANYPEPAEGWNPKDAPALYDSGLEAADGDRRLTSDVTYDLVPYGEQVQRLMKAALKEARRFRKHTFVLPPSAWVLEPLDYVSYSSDRNGYDDKLFRVDLATDKANLDVIVSLTEVDPADYDWDPDTDYQPFTNGPLVIRRPGSQDIVDWSATGITIVGDNGVSKAGIRLSWDDDVHDVDGIQFQVRRQSSSVLVYSGETDFWDAGAIDISQNLSGNTVYEVRGKYRPHSDRDTSWSGWLSVSTPDVKIQGSELADGAITKAKFLAGLTPVEIVSSLPGTGTEGEIVVLTTDGKLYRWHSGAWTAAVPTVDLVGTVTAAQIAAFAIDNTKLASGLTTVEIVSVLPTTGNFIGRTVFLTTDSKLYRYNGTAFTTKLDGTDIAAGTLTTAAFASTITPLEIVSTLPVTGNFAGRLVFLTTDKKIYRYDAVAAAFTKAVDGADLVANSITAGQIAAGAIGATQIAAQAIIASKIVVGDPSNLLAGADLSDAAAWTLGANTLINTANVIVTSTLKATAAFQLASDGTTGQAMVTVGQITPNFFSVEQGASYRLGAIAGYSGTFNGRVRLGIRWFDNTGTFIQEDFVALGTDYRAGAPGSVVSETINSTVTPPANAVEANFRVTGIWPGAGASAGSAYVAFVRANRVVDNSLIVDGTINASKLVVGSITAGAIAAGAIGTTQLAALAVTAGKIAAGTITAAKMVAGTLTSNEIASNTILAANMAANSITSSKLAANSVTAGAIAAGAIVASNIVAGTITANELQIGAASSTAQLSGTLTGILTGYTTLGHVDVTAIGTAPIMFVVCIVCDMNDSMQCRCTISGGNFFGSQTGTDFVMQFSGAASGSSYVPFVEFPHNGDTVRCTLSVKANASHAGATTQWTLYGYQIIR